MEQQNQFDLIIIGSGPGGYKAAVIACQLGAKVALIEKAQAGGTCLNRGCVPKEALVRIAKLIDDIKAFEGLGLKSEVYPDFQAAMAHKSQLVSSIRETVPPWLRRLGIKFFEGEGNFVNPKTINIVGNDGTKHIIQSDRIIIATGSKSKNHPTLPLENSRIINSTQFMENPTTLPKKVLCVGGGAISTEIGFVLHQFGSEVTILEKSNRLLNKFNIPERASEMLMRRFKQLNINVKTNTNIKSYSSTDDNIAITFNDDTRDEYDTVLVAIGRKPNTDKLQLENANVQTDEMGSIKTNEYLETSTPGIYAIGDVKVGPMTANAAFHDAKIAANNALNGNTSATNYNRVPIVIDSALQIACVGLTEERAEEAGFEPDVARINLAGTTKARLTQDVQGYIEVVHDEETAQLLGGSIVGPQAREMIHTMTAACQSKRGLWFFTDLNYSHPSWNEELENAIYQYVNEFNKSGDPIFRPGIYALYP